MPPRCTLFCEGAARSYRSRPPCDHVHRYNARAFLWYFDNSAVVACIERGHSSSHVANELLEYFVRGGGCERI